MAFSYAHKQLRTIQADAELTAKMEAEYKAVKHIAPNGKSYTTAHAWNFNSLLHEEKQEHPIEELVEF